MSKQQDIVTEIRDITPDWAAEALEHHDKRIADGEFHQRGRSQATVIKYASDMASGNWLLTHQGIAFDLNDDLIDGQHRLEAVVKAGKTVKMMVTTGFPVGSKPGETNGKASIIDVVDGGKARSVEAMMRIHGMAYAKNYTTCMRAIARVAHNGRTPILTYATVSWMLNDLNLSFNVGRIVSVSPHISDFQGKIIGPLAYYHTAYPKKAMDFAEALFNYSGGKGHPASLFLSWSKTHTRLHSSFKMTALAACLRAADEKRDIEMIRLNREAMEWLSSVNPKLRDQIKARVPTSH